MFQNLQNLGWGLVGFALIVGVGTVILHEFGGAVADCTASCESASYENATYNSSLGYCHDPGNHTNTATAGTATLRVWNSSSDKCVNSSNSNATTPQGTGWTNTNFLITELGSTGLAGWVPAIIAVSVGMLLFGAFLIGNSGDRKY